MRAVASEFIKLYTTKLWLWLALVVVGFCGLFSALISAAEDYEPDFTGNTTAALPLGEIIVNLAPIGFAMAGVIGIIGMTGEFRHQTATPTFLAIPHRGVVVSGKLVVYFMYGVLLGALFIITTVGIGDSILTGKGFTSALELDAFNESAFYTIPAIALFGLFGVGAGALIGNQAAAITITVIYIVAVQPILLAFETTRDFATYLPAAAAQAVILPNYSPIEGFEILGRGQGALLLIMYSLGLAIIGSILAVSRDIT